MRSRPTLAALLLLVLLSGCSVLGGQNAPPGGSYVVTNADNTSHTVKIRVEEPERHRSTVVLDIRNGDSVRVPHYLEEMGDYTVNVTLDGAQSRQVEISLSTHQGPDDYLNVTIDERGELRVTAKEGEPRN